MMFGESGKKLNSTNIKKIGCRAAQFCVKSGMYLLPWRIPEVMKGEGVSRRLPVAVKRKNLKKPLIVTGPTVRGCGLLDGMLETMENFKIPYVIFDKVTPNPTDEDVEQGAALFRENQCDCIIAFGGGSPMDCAKAIGARIARPGKPAKKLQGLFRILRPIPVLFAVPTTAGSGSETTIAAVITETSTHHKAPIMDLCLMPKYVVLDPALTIGLPFEVTAAGGIDALCHAVEAYTNHTYNTRLEEKLALRAVKLIYKNLRKVCEDGSDMEARQKMQEAAFCAGRAFTRGCVGYAHAIGHPLSGLYGLSHGNAVGILLPHVLRAYGEAAQKRLAELSDVCALTAADESEAAKADAFIRWIEELKETLGIPVYPDVMREEDIEQIAQWAAEEANPLYPVPVVWSRGEIKEFIRSLLPVPVQEEKKESAPAQDKKSVSTSAPEQGTGSETEKGAQHDN